MSALWFWGIVFVLVANVGTLVRRLWRLLVHGAMPPIPSLELISDALTVITGTYVLALLIDLTLSGRIPHWGALEYIFTSLIVFNVVLIAAFSILAGRRS